MKTHGLVFMGLVSLAMSGFLYGESEGKCASVYQNRCANCHGIAANGVPKLKEQHGMTAQDAAAQGASSQEKGNIYGPPLNMYSKEELVNKLIGLRNKDFDNSTYHSEMRKNLKMIEAREGKISDERMADYIHRTFGSLKK